MTSRSKLKTAGGLVVALLTVASFVGGAMDAQAQQKAKRKFGPGQNVPRGVPQQGARPPAAAKAAPETIGKFGKWVVQCDAVKKPADGSPPPKRACAMVQVALNAKNKKIGLTLILARLKQGKETATMMRIMAPISVYLPTGVALEVDGAAAGRVPFTRCLPQTCMAFAQVRKETLAKMKKGKKGKFLIYEAPGIGIPIDLDLTGFSSALKSLDKAQ